LDFVERFVKFYLDLAVKVLSLLNSGI